MRHHSHYPHTSALALQRRPWLLAALSLCTLAACGGSKPPSTTSIPAGATVLALGDSLTAGVGARSGEDFPSLLTTLTEWDVVNGGVPGNTSEQALARLPALLEEHAPSLILVGLGGNDFLRRVERQRTEQALTQIVHMAREAGAQVVLIAMPQASLLAAAGAALSDHPMYAELAQRLNVPVVATAWSTVLNDAALRADTMHANAQGYAAFTAQLAQALRDMGLLRHA